MVPLFDISMLLVYENIMKNRMAIDHGNAMLTKTAYI